MYFKVSLSPNACFWTVRGNQRIERKPPVKSFNNQTAPSCKQMDISLILILTVFFYNSKTALNFLTRLIVSGPLFLSGERESKTVDCV